MNRFCILLLATCIPFIALAQFIPESEKPAGLYEQESPAPFYGLRKIWNPAWYQGGRRSKSYFEGWYFKLAGPDAKSVYAIIPGVSIHENPNSSYAFIQFLNGNTGESHFIRFSSHSFRYSRKRFAVSIGQNFFSRDSICLNICSDQLKLKGKLYFTGLVEYPVGVFSPGIMGWYRFVPGMECYHGIISMQHRLEGKLDHNRATIDFKGGKGYIEKDWGTSMPGAWIWIQCNHFISSELSVSLSIAHVPWRKSAFTGFLAVVSSGDELYRFTTYTGAEIQKLVPEQDFVRIEIKDKRYQLKLDVSSKVSGTLKAPVQGELSRPVQESIGAMVEIKLFDRKGQLILNEKGLPAGYERVGNMQLLLDGLQR